jgi:PAS domain S-box-containing protein
MTLETLAPRTRRPRPSQAIGQRPDPSNHDPSAHDPAQHRSGKHRSGKHDVKQCELQTAPNSCGNGPSQQAVAQLGLRALSSDIEGVLQDAAETMREALGVPMTGFSELIGDGSWVRQHYTTSDGTVTLENTLEHFNLESLDQVFAKFPDFQILDWSQVTTIRAPSELIDKGVVSSMGVPVRNMMRTFGFWGVHTFSARAFNAEEVAFAQSVANVIASALERHRMTEELRARKMQYRTLIDHFPNGTVQLFDHDLRISVAGGEALTKSARTPADMEGKLLREIIPDSSLLELHMNSALKGHEMRLETHQNGRWQEFHVLPVFAADGQISGGMMMSQDIDDRKRAEEALRQNEEQLTGILDALEDVVWSANVEGTRTIFMSSAAQRIYGLPSQAFLEDPQLWISIIHPDDLKRVSAAHDRLLLEGTFSIEYRIVRPDGEVRWLSDRGRPVLDASGQAIRIDGIASDITARKRDELALKQREEQYRTLVKNLPDELVLLFDRKLRITAAGGTLLSRLGLHSDELEGQTVYALEPHLPKGLHTLCMNTVNNEAVHQTLKHHGLEIDLHIMPILDDDGNFSSGMMLAHDVTEHRIAAELEARHQRELEGMFEGISDAFISLDRDGRFVRLNVPALKFLGRENHEVIGKLVADVLSGQDSFAANIAQAVQNGKSEMFEGFMPQTNTWYSARVFPVERGFVLYVVDTSETKRREATAQETNQRLEWRITQLAALHEASAAIRERLRATDEAWEQTFDLCAREGNLGKPIGKR